MAMKRSIAYMAPVEAISRKFIPRKCTAANKAGSGEVQKRQYGWFGGAVVNGPTKYEENRQLTFFVVRKFFRTSDLSEAEVNARAKFATCRAAVKVRMKNLSTITADQAAFLAQKDSANGIKSFYAYIWSLEVAAYDQAHPQG